MKPSFALDLRDDQVTLLHRTPRGWQQIGTTRFDAPDLAEALAYMRSTALGLSPRGISTKLIIPNDQILYTTVTAPGPDAAKRKRQVKAALDGLTPYAVDDLVYDTQGTGPDVHVAVIARETLEQAEAFAAEHRFNPVSFVAVPDNGLFTNEPFFGPSQMSPALLSDGEKVERDGEPVSIVARDVPRKAEPEPLAEAASEPAPAVEAVAEPASDAAATVPPAPEAVPAPAAEVSVEPVAAAVEPEPEPKTEPAVAAELPAAPAPVQPPAPPAAEVGVTAPGIQAAPSPKAEAKPAAVVEEAPMALDVPAEEPAPAPTPADLKKSLAPVQPAPLPVEDDIPAAPADAVRAALAARRAQQAGGAPALGAASASRPASARPVGAIDAQAMKPAAKAAPPKASAPGKALKSMGAMVTSPVIPGAGRRKAQTPTPAPQPAASATAAAPGAKPTAKPGAGLGGRPMPVRGKPRYLGLILTGVLLVFLALIAAWSSFFLAGDPVSTDATGTAISQAEAPADPNALAMTDATAADPTAADEAAADGQDAELAAAADSAAPPPEDEAAADMAAADTAAGPAPSATDAAVAEALATTDAGTPDAATTDVATADVATADAGTTLAASAEATEAAAAAAPAADPAPGTAVSTEAATAGTPESATGDEIVLAGQEPPTRLSDPVSLPDAALTGDALPAAAPEPPPFGTVYKFDADGRIIPTPEGIETPEGVTLVAGKPPKVPGPRPAAIAALAPAPVAPAADAATAAPGAIPLTGDEVAPPGEPFPSDPALEGFKPKSRPAGLVPAVATPDAAEPPPAADPRLAGVRPRSRASSPVLAALAPAEPAAAASASTAGLDGAEAAVAGGTALAVAVSRLPAERPAALSQAVNAAVASAAEAPPADAPAEPEAQAEPEVETAMPAIPTKAAVAKTATEKDALAMNKVALIGVFGADNANRYAYVRMGNGALKKVKVGDTLDGGTVVAISASELRYQKGSKLVVLQMPRES